MTELATNIFGSARAATPPTTMVLEGEIARTDLIDIAGMLLRLADRGVTQVVMDLSDVSHFDFRGVKPLLECAVGFREAGGDLKLAGLSPYLHAIFRSAGGAGQFDFFPTSTDAQAAFHRAVFVAA